jgi:DNA-binding transcriptional LysR family regulator
VRDIDLSQVNLNLMVALDALIAERSVTRAARRLGVSQSAMSHSLRQLREIFDDTLLVRGKGGMQPTPRALRLAVPLAHALSSMRRALRGEEDFDPATSTRRFTLAMLDATAMILLPVLMTELREAAPGVDLDIVSFEPRSYGLQLETGEVDLCVSVAFPDVPGVRLRRTSPHSFVCLVRQDHPCVGESLTLETWAKLPHILVSPQGSGGPGIVDTALAQHGLERRVAVRIRYFLAAPMLVAESDLVLTTTRALAGRFLENFPLRVLEPPVELPTFRVGAAWHERFQDDPASQWLRGKVIDALKTHIDASVS